MCSFNASIGLLPLMKMSCKGFKDVWIDLIIKMCSFNTSIGLLPLILIVNEDELLFQGHTNRFHQDTEQNV